MYFILYRLSIKNYFLYIKVNIYKIWIDFNILNNLFSVVVKKYPRLCKFKYIHLFKVFELFLNSIINYTLRYIGDPNDF